MSKSTEAMQARISAMTKEERDDLVSSLVAKAEQVLRGDYDQDLPGDNNLWAGDLYAAAGRIQRLEAKPEDVEALYEADSGRFKGMTAGEAEEIEALLS